MTRGWHHHVIALLSRLVPRERRSEWRREWDAELRNFELQLAGGTSDRARHWRLLARSLGAFPDACYLSAHGSMTKNGPVPFRQTMRAVRSSLPASVVVMTCGAVAAQVLAVLSFAFSDSDGENTASEWITYWTANVGVTVGYSLPFAIPGAVFGHVWSASPRHRTPEPQNPRVVGQFAYWAPEAPK